MSLVQLYQVEYFDKTVDCDIKLVLPTLSDIKYLLLQNPDTLLDLFLLKELTITPIQVIKDSKLHKTALQNRLLDMNSKVHKQEDQYPHRHVLLAVLQLGQFYHQH